MHNLAAEVQSVTEGCPSIDPELVIRLLIVGYVFAIRPERLICRAL
jgi:transposase